MKRKTTVFGAVAALALVTGAAGAATARPDRPTSHEARSDRDSHHGREERFRRGEDRRFEHDRRRNIAPRPNYRHRSYFWGQRFRIDNRYRAFDYMRYYRAGYGWYGPRGSHGWRVLYPWLADNPATRHWVMWEFDRNRDGRLSRSEASRANRGFQRLADFNRDGRLSRWEIREAVNELTDEYRWSYRYG